MAGPDFADIPRMLALLDNRTRRIVLETLAMQPLTQGQLLEHVSVRQPTLAYHMDLLLDAHVITRSFEEPGFHIEPGHVRLLNRYVYEVLTPADAHFNGRF